MTANPASGGGGTLGAGTAGDVTAGDGSSGVVVGGRATAASTVAVEGANAIAAPEGVSPWATAVLVSVPAARSPWVTVWVAAHVTNAVGANDADPAGQAMGDRPPGETLASGPWI